METKDEVPKSKNTNKLVTYSPEPLKWWETPSIQYS